MSRIGFASLAGLGAAILISAGLSVEATRGKSQDGSPKAPDPEKPGLEVSRLKAFEGTWDGEVKFCKEHAGGGTAKGVETNKIGLGGFWLVSDHRCETPQGPYLGHGILGYDQAKKEYVLAMANSMNSHLGLFSGSFSGEKGELILNGSEVTGPDGKLWKLKAVYSPRDEDHFNFALLASSGDVKDCSCVSISYVRKGEASKHHKD